MKSKRFKALLGGRLVLPLSLVAINHAEAQNCVQPPPGLVSWWPGDGTTDDIQANNDGTLVGAASFVPGQVREAFSLNGTTDYMEVPFNANLDIRNAITIDAWVMKQGLCMNNCVIVMKQDGLGPCCGLFRYGLLIYGTGGVAPGKATFAFNTGTWDDVVISNSTLSDNVWYHLAGTYDGTTARIYVNGVLDNTASKTGAILASTAGPLFIGRDQGGFGSQELFNGLIDEVEIFDRALSASEIQGIFNAGSAGKCIDETPPTFGDCPAGGPFLLNSGSQSVGPIAAQDPDSGIDTENSMLTGAVDTSAVGPQTVTFIAVNTEGSAATQDCSYAVHYHFSGFFQPIDNTLPNSAKAGQPVPVKWRLTDANGASVSDPQSFVNVSSSATPSACGGAADAIETYAGSSGLQYLGDGYWQFNWKTPKAYAGQCRTMRLNLQDGAPGRTAAFVFK